MPAVVHTSVGVFLVLHVEEVELALEDHALLLPRHLSHNGGQPRRCARNVVEVAHIVAVVPLISAQSSKQLLIIIQHHI